MLSFKVGSIVANIYFIGSIVPKWGGIKTSRQAIWKSWYGWLDQGFQFCALDNIFANPQTAELQSFLAAVI